MVAEEDRDAYIGRQERRIADQAPRKNGGAAAVRPVGNREKNNHLKIEDKNTDSKHQVVPLAINLKNLRNLSKDD